MVWTDLAPVEAQPRLLAVSEHLPQGNSEHPRVCGVGEGPGLQALWSAPETPQKQTKASITNGLKPQSKSV